MASPAAAVVTTKALTGLDIGIIAVYFVIIFGIGVYFARKGRSSVDYFLAGRNVGWFAIGASLFVNEPVDSPYLQGFQSCVSVLSPSASLSLWAP